MRKFFVIALFILLNLCGLSQTEFKGLGNSNQNSDTGKQLSTVKIWVVSLSAIILLGTVAYVLRWRKELQFQHQKTLEAKFNLLKCKRVKKESALLNQIVDLENQVLINQINPHFIFNCLNAINYFILNNDTQAASDYLTKCSVLIRRVLQNSSEKTISLTEELTTLNLYLDLEQQRLKNHFTYTVQQKGIYNTDELMVPPLLLQPFVENAIWHGLMPKKEAGKLTIDIENEGNRLCFVITDNGVGRQKNSRNSINKKPNGLEITARRLHMMSESKKQSFLQIIDLKDAENKSNGTKVIIKIPLKLTPATVQV